MADGLSTAVGFDVCEQIVDVESSDTENIGLRKAVLDSANASSNKAVSSANILCIGLLTSPICIMFMKKFIWPCT